MTSNRGVVAVEGGRMSHNHGCGHKQVERLEPSREAADRATQEARLLIEGMGCRNCAARVHNALVSLLGVGAADVWLDPPVAVVRYDPSRVPVTRMVSAVSDAGTASHHHYRATLLEPVAG